MKMISIVIDCQLIKVCLYDCVCCNYGLFVFNLYLLTFIVLDPFLFVVCAMQY